MYNVTFDPNGGGNSRAGKARRKEKRARWEKVTWDRRSVGGTIDGDQLSGRNFVSSWKDKIV
jgi:hypothetical protein